MTKKIKHRVEKPEEEQGADEAQQQPQQAAAPKITYSSPEEAEAAAAALEFANAEIAAGRDPFASLNVRTEDGSTGDANVSVAGTGVSTTATTAKPAGNVAGASTSASTSSANNGASNGASNGAGGLTARGVKGINTGLVKAPSAANEVIPDEFQMRGLQAFEWTQKHTTLVLGLAGVVLVAGLAWAGFSSYKDGQNEKASKPFAEALEIYDAPIVKAGDENPEMPIKGPRFATSDEKTRVVLERFQAVAQNHAGTDVGTLALLYVGNASLQSKKYDDAIKAYESFLQKTDADGDTYFAGLQGLAAAYEGKQDRKNAIAQYEKLAGLPTQIAEDVALLALGRLYQAEGDVEKARDRLSRLADKDAFTKSPLKTRAEEMLALLPAVAVKNDAKPDAAKPDAAKSDAKPDAAKPANGQ